MQPNSTGEYNIPGGNHNPESQTPIYDELDYIYQNKPQEAPSYHQIQAERAPSFESIVLYDMAASLAEARSYRMDAQLFTQTETENSFFRKIGKRLFSFDLSPRHLKSLELRDLVEDESEIGATIFGARQPNEKLKFFNEDKENWFFSQTLKDAKGKDRSITFRYEVRPEGVLWAKQTESGISYDYLKSDMLDTFLTAAEMYHERVMRQIYNRDPSTGKLLK